MRFLSRLPVLFAFLGLLLATTVDGQTSPGRLSDKEVKQLMADVDANVPRFEKSLSREMRTAKIRSEATEVDVKAFLKDLATTCKQMKKRFNASYSASAEVNACLRRAYGLQHREAQGLSLLGGEQEWPRLKTSLVALGTQYGVDFEAGPEDWKVRRLNDKEVVEISQALAKEAKSFKKALSTSAKANKEIPAQEKKQIEDKVTALGKAASDLGKAVKKGTDPSGHASLIVSHVADIGQFIDKYALGPPAASAFESVRRPAAQLGQACRVTQE
jgi:hypothetical protein